MQYEYVIVTWVYDRKVCEFFFDIIIKIAVVPCIVNAAIHLIYDSQAIFESMRVYAKYVHIQNFAR